MLGSSSSDYSSFYIHTAGCDIPSQISDKHMKTGFLQMGNTELVLGSILCCPSTRAYQAAAMNFQHHSLYTVSQATAILLIHPLNTVQEGS